MDPSEPFSSSTLPQRTHRAPWLSSSWDEAVLSHGVLSSMQLTSPCALPLRRLDMLKVRSEPAPSAPCVPTLHAPAHVWDASHWLAKRWLHGARVAAVGARAQLYGTCNGAACRHATIAVSGAYCPMQGSSMPRHSHDGSRRITGSARRHACSPMSMHQRQCSQCTNAHPPAQRPLDVARH
jgi:hypothetical protein